MPTNDSKINEYLSLLELHPELKIDHDQNFKIIDDPKEILEWQEAKYSDLYRKKLPLEWANIGIVLSDKFIIVIRDLVEFQDKRREGYIRIINREDLSGGIGVAVLPIYKNKILLLHQYRHATQSWHYEVPRGFGEANISAEENVIKEIKEEINGEIEVLSCLGNYYNNTGLDASVTKLFYAKIQSYGEPNQNEGISKIRSVDKITIEKMIASGEINDGFTIAAYFRVKLAGII